MSGAWLVLHGHVMDIWSALRRAGGLTLVPGTHAGVMSGTAADIPTPTPLEPKAAAGAEAPPAPAQGTTVAASPLPAESPAPAQRQPPPGSAERRGPPHHRSGRGGGGHGHGRGGKHQIEVPEGAEPELGTVVSHQEKVGVQWAEGPRDGAVWLAGGSTAAAPWQPA